MISKVAELDNDQNNIYSKYRFQRFSLNYCDISEWHDITDTQLIDKQKTEMAC